MPRRRFLIFAIPCLLFWHWFDPVARQNDRGIRLLEQNTPAAALTEFLAARGRRPDEPSLQLNTALAMYRLGKFAQARAEWEATQKSARPPRPAEVAYNLGNALYRLEEYEQALAQYRQSLLRDPSDRQAKKNYEWTQKKIRERQEKERQQKQEEEQQPQEQKQQPPPPPQKKYDPIMQYLDQNERQQLEKKKQGGLPMGLEKDW